MKEKTKSVVIPESLHCALKTEAIKRRHKLADFTTELLRFALNKFKRAAK